MNTTLRHISSTTPSTTNTTITQEQPPARHPNSINHVLLHRTKHTVQQSSHSPQPSALIRTKQGSHPPTRRTIATIPATMMPPVTNTVALWLCGFLATPRASWTVLAADNRVLWPMRSSAGRDWMEARAGDDIRSHDVVGYRALFGSWYVVVVRTVCIDWWVWLLVSDDISALEVLSRCFYKL